MFQGGKAGDQLGDAIGRAWAVGLLDGTTQDPAILRDKGREYANLRAIVYRCTGTAVGELEPRSRGTGEGAGKDPVGERFAKLDELARNAGSKQRLAMQKLCVDGSPDENPEWLDRLIRFEQSARTLSIPTICDAELPSIRDHMIMAQALAALVSMVEG